MPFIDRSPLSHIPNSSEAIRRWDDVRAPTSSDYKQFRVWDFWRDKVTKKLYIMVYKDATQGSWTLVAAGTASAESFLPDSGTSPVVPDALNQVSLLGGTGLGTVGGLNSVTFNVSQSTTTALGGAEFATAIETGQLTDTTRMISPSGLGPILTSNYVVDPGGAYTSIQSALDAANAAGGHPLVVTPGTYTEDLILYDKCHITGINFADATGGVVIVGKHTPPASGGFVFNFVQLETADYIFSSVVAGTAHLIIGNAALVVTNGYTFNLPNWTGKLETYDVNDRGSTNDGYVNNTAGAEIAIFSAEVGAGVANPMILSGTCSIFTCAVGCPINFITGSSSFLEYNVHTADLNFSNNSTGEVIGCEIDADIIMNSTAGWTVASCTINSSTINVISGTGSGILSIAGLDFIDSSGIAPALTVSGGKTISGSMKLLDRTETAVSIYGSEGELVEVGPLTDGQLIIGSTGLAPAAASLLSADGSVVITPSAGGIDLSTVSATGESFIPDSGTSPVVPDALNQITLAGGTGLSTVGGLNLMTFNVDQATTTELGGAETATSIETGQLTDATRMVTPSSLGDSLLSKFVVGSGGAYTSVQSAVTAANIAGDGFVYVKSGTYNENLTLYDKIIISGIGQDAIINGNHTPPASGDFKFRELTLTAATGDIFTSAAAGTASLECKNCVFNITNGYVYNLSNWVGELSITSCFDNSSDNGVVSNIGAATVFINNSTIGSGTALSMQLTGYASMEASNVMCPISVEGSSTVDVLAASFLFAPITTSNSATLTLMNCAIDTGASVPIVHNSSGSMTLSNLTINTSNTQAINGTGLGVVTMGVIDFLDGSSVDVTTSVSNTKITTTDLRAWNGSFIEQVSTSVTSDGAVITLSAEKDGGGDLSLINHNGFYHWDTTPAVTVTLTAGTDMNPQINYVYLDGITKVLTASTVSFPATGHGPIAVVLCQSAASLQTEGAYKVHQWTDHLTTSLNTGHIGDINNWIRTQNATWVDGVVQSYNITTNPGVPDNVNIDTTSGNVLQLHQHTFPAFSAPYDYYVINDNVTPYTIITDLNAALTDSTGASMSGKYFSLVLIGVVSESTGDCKMFLNLPSGSYNSASLLTADSSKYANFTIPSEFKGTGFLISQWNLKHSTSSGGTWTSIDEVDLRGLFPGISAGSGTAASTEFPDNTFRIFDEGDNTKQIAFEASGITTATTRTVEIQDKDGVMAYLSDVHRSYEEVTVAAKAMLANEVYGANNIGGVVFDLPTTAAVGTTVEITGILGTWSITQAAGQTIYIGDSSSTTGVLGGVAALDDGDCITLRCIVADLDWRSTSLVGNLDIT